MQLRFVIAIGVLTAGALGAGIFLYANRVQDRINATEERFRALEQKLVTIEESLGILAEREPLTVLDQPSISTEERANEIAELEKKIESLQKRKPSVMSVPQSIPQFPQPDRLTATVAKTAPAVVSIVISRDVPQLEVTYQNPFGNDPFFQDFGIRVPVYRQRGTTKKKVGAGTGFLISNDGYIVTNKHVVLDEAAEYMVLLSTGGQKKAKVIYRDGEVDVALLDIEGEGYSSIRLGDSSKIELGESVVAIGNALGEYNNSVSRGIVSGLDRTVKAAGPRGESEELSGVIQTDAAINPGNSGGPLLTFDGKAIGVNVATVLGSNNISFAIPINRVRDIVRHYVPGVEVFRERKNRRKKKKSWRRRRASCWCGSRSVLSRAKQIRRSSRRLPSILAARKA